MSGLSAVALPQGQDAGAMLDAMLARMAHYPWLRRASRVDASIPVGLGVVSLGHEAAGAVATSADGRAVAVLHGELFDVAPEARAEQLLDGWRRDGARYLARLNGEFAGVIWDAGKGELVVITDRFGLRPVYLAQPPGRFAVASEIKSVLAVSGVDTSWSDAGVAQFFAFGHFFGDDTLLQGVRAMPAATCGVYRMADGRYEETRYWRLRPGSGARSSEEHAAAVEEAFVKAVARRARPGEKLGLSLSGGLDARTILGVMPPGLDVTTVSLGIDGSLDHRCAAELSALAGVPHHRHVLDAGFLSEFERHLRQMVRLTDGHYLDQGIVMPTLPVYRDLGIQCLIRGHGGELLHMRKAYAYSVDDAALRASDAEIERWLLAHLTAYMLTAVPDDLFRVDLRAGAEAAVRAALQRCEPARRPVDRVWQLFLNERIHRETALSMHKFGCFASIRQPYFDNDLIDVLFSMPAETKLGDRLQTTILRHRQAAFLGVTNSNTGARLGAGRIETALARLRLRAGAKLGLKGYQPYERLGRWLRGELRAWVESTLSEPAFLDAGLFRPDAVRRLVHEHVEHQANHTFLLMALLVFGMRREQVEQAEDGGAADRENP